MEKNKDKKKIILTGVAVIVLLVVVIGAAFAFFTAQTGIGQSANIKADTATTDSLKFEAGKTLKIDATQQNFGKDTGNQSDETIAKATLVANNATNQASDNYYVYLDIISNTLKYTTEDKQAELLLQVTGPAGEVTSIPGLSYVTSGTESGFDITEAQDLITIADQYLIESTGTEEQTWTIKIVLVNLDSNQNENTGKSFIADVKIQKEKINTTIILADYIKRQYVSQGVNGLYLHNETLENGAGDNSYRYAGSNDVVNNYVCFGSNAETCPDDNLYRIIGVFGDQVKLIKKNVSEDDVFWWGSFSPEKISEWSESTFNTDVLNGTYLNSFSDYWKNKIVETNWQVNGMSQNPGKENNAKSAYDNEIKKNNEDTTYSAKIGLMYVSDYGYSASDEHWTKRLLDYADENTPENNWMYIEDFEWTITRVFDVSFSYIFTIDRFGRVIISSDLDGYSDTKSGIPYRPVFFLESTVNYVSGSGMATDPIRLG